MCGMFNTKKKNDWIQAEWPLVKGRKMSTNDDGCLKPVDLETGGAPE